MGGLQEFAGLRVVGSGFEVFRVYELRSCNSYSPISTAFRALSGLGFRHLGPRI